MAEPADRTIRDKSAEFRPTVTVIVPGHNASNTLEQCLSCIRAQDYPLEALEILFVDDSSTDDSASIAARWADKVVVLPGKKKGPAAARNAGVAQARGEVIIFFDADTVAPAGTVRSLVERLNRSDRPDAVFGSYDSEPLAKNFVSQYRNLLHHFVHQTSRGEASTFWAGCGAIWKKSFLAAGGFDSDRYARPMIEDIELGHRMRVLGMHIALERSITVKHLKRWTLLQMIECDVFQRGIPWVRLLLRDTRSSNELGDLNLKKSAFLSVALAWAGVALVFASLWDSRLLAMVLLILAGGLALNWPINRFFLIARGIGFTLMSAPLQYTYHLYNGFSVVLALLLQLRDRTSIGLRSLGSALRRG